MSSLISFAIKKENGEYQKLTMSIQDKVNDYGQNVSIYLEQSKEQRDAKEKKQYVGNGKVFWTDGKISVAKQSESLQSTENEF